MICKLKLNKSLYKQLKIVLEEYTQIYKEYKKNKKYEYLQSNNADFGICWFIRTLPNNDDLSNRLEIAFESSTTGYGWNIPQIYYSSSVNLKYMKYRITWMKKQLERYENSNSGGV